MSRVFLSQAAFDDLILVARIRYQREAGYPEGE
jgi:hypothetical protein